MRQSHVDTIYLIHHSHVDIGFTHDQPVVWDLHRRFLDVALDLCERDAGRDDDAAFRWAIETTCGLQHWLERSSDRQIARFVELAQAGRIEATAMFTNMRPLYDADQIIESLSLLRTLRRDFGIPIRHAMNSDVNGQSWILVDVLRELGLSAISMSINAHFGGALDPFPLVFHWQGPSGHTIPALNGLEYGWARSFLGIGQDPRIADDAWPRLDAWLAAIDYPLPVLMLQYMEPFGDNGSADPSLPAFVRAWNAAGRRPRLKIALPQDWWQVVAQHAHLLPTLRGDWTDFWNFGAGSCAREMAMGRASRARLYAADATWAAVRAAGSEDDLSGPRVDRLRAEAYQALNLWDEHTYGADCSVERPDDEDTAAQWYHKAGYGYTARSLSLLLARDGVAELARRVTRASDDALLVFNPLPWERTVAGIVPDPQPSTRRPWTPNDGTAARHFRDRTHPIAARALTAVRVPAFGYTLVRASALMPCAAHVSANAVVANHRHCLTFDCDHGGVVGWHDSVLNRELVDQSVAWPLHAFVHERPVDDKEPASRHLAWRRPFPVIPPKRGWQPGWPAERLGSCRLLEHRVEQNDLGIRVVQRLEAPGVRNLVQEVFLPAYADHIECRSTWTMLQETSPEATYLAFPLQIPAARVRLDLGGQSMQPEVDQLPGACRDYFTVQRWIDFEGDNFGVTVACPTTPMVQLGDFSFGKNQAKFALARPTLLGWVTNNYWDCNHPAQQPGVVSACYWILPYDGPFSEARSHRFGGEATVPPLFQHLGESPVIRPPFPRSGTLLQLPADPVLTLHVKPASVGAGTVLRLLNASDAPATARVASGTLRLHAAQLCDLLEQPLEELPVRDGAVALDLQARGLACVRLDISSFDGAEPR